MIFVMAEDEIRDNALAIHLRDTIVQSFVEIDVRCIGCGPSGPVRTANRVAAHMIELLGRTRIQPALELLGRHPREVISRITHPKVRLLVRDRHPVMTIGRLQEAGIFRCRRRNLSLLALESLDVAGDAVIPLALPGGGEPDYHSISAIPKSGRPDSSVSR